MHVVVVSNLQMDQSKIGPLELMWMKKWSNRDEEMQR